MCSPARPAVAVLVAAVALTTAGPVRGQTSWLGITSSDWGATSNWSAGVPTAAIDATFTAVANQLITLSANQAVRATTFNSASGYSIGGPSTLTVNGTLTQSGAGAVTISANLNLGGFVFDVGGSGSGPISLSGAASNGIMRVTLTAASGTMTLGGTTANEVPVHVTKGLLQLNKPDGVTAVSTLTVSGTGQARYLAGDQADVISFGAGTTVVDLNGFHETVASLSDNGVGSTGQLRLGGGSLTFGTGSSTSMSGVEITGTGGRLIKQGTGVTVLGRAAGHTYTGGTTINAGILDIQNTSGSGTGTGAVQVTGGGTLRGSGTVAGPVTVAGGGTIAANLGSYTNPRTLDLGSLSLAATSTTVVSLRGLTPGDTDTSYSQINVVGAADLGGSLSVGLGSGFDPTGGTFFILSRGSGSGEFAGLPEGSLVVFAGYQGTITYLADWTGSQGTSALFGGNDVAIHNVVPVPEPGWVLLTAAAGLTVAAARRCRAQLFARGEYTRARHERGGLHRLPLGRRLAERITPQSLPSQSRLPA